MANNPRPGSPCKHSSYGIPFRASVIRRLTNPIHLKRIHLALSHLAAIYL